MDLVYTVHRKISQRATPSNEWLCDCHSICAISSRNTVAYTSNTKLESSSGRTWNWNVYVADLNSPWNYHLVTEHNQEITCLDWDVSGGKIFFTDVTGAIQIWTMKDYLLNEWVHQTTVAFKGEHFLCAAWFHSGKKMVLNAENKKDSGVYTEKFLNSRFSPSIRHFGGRPRSGIIAVSVTGMVCAVVLALGEGGPIYSSECLGIVRSRLKIVDLCYGKNGDFLVAASDGAIPSTVQCFQVTLRLNDEKCSITCQTLPSFYPTATNPASSTSTDTKPAPVMYRITQLRFVLREAADAVVVCLASNGESCLELWELREKQLPLHKMFATGPHADSKLKTVLWQRHSAEYRANATVVALTTPRTTIMDSNPAPSYILAAYSDQTIKCFFRDSLRLHRNVTINPALHSNAGSRSFRISSTISDMQLTWSGSAALAIDASGQAYLYRLAPVTDPGVPVSVGHTVMLLEFALVSGWDWWDVILGLRSNLIESVCDKLTEGFAKQPEPIQQYWFSRLLMIKLSLYRCLVSHQTKAGDCFALMMLNAISTSFKSLLRPTDMSGQDKGPAENLTALLKSKLAENDMDKVLLIFDKHKEFFVESGTLQSLQPLIQWVADFTLYLLATLPHQQQGGSTSSAHFPGCGLVNDLKALYTLRELLITTRMWGLIQPTCLPVFVKTTEHVDFLSLLFKLITKVIACHGKDMDDALIDECCLLTSQVLVPAPILSVDAVGVASPALFKTVLPLPFEFGSEPESIGAQLTRDANVAEGCLASNQKYDAVRQMYMGVSPPACKQCTRCSSMSMLKIVPKSLATKSWEQRWTRTCPCGGQWTVTSH